MKARLRSIGIVGIVSISTAATGMFATSGAAAPRELAPRSAEEAVADTLDEDNYIRAYGVATADDARREWEAIDQAGQLQVVLKREESDVFGGLWIEHDPSFAVVIGVLAGHAKELDPYVSSAELTEVVRIEEVEKTYTDLERDLQAARKAALFGADYGSGIDQSEGRVKIFVESPFQLESFASVELPESVDVEVLGIQQPGIDIYGGLSTSNGCTFGFSVEETSGTREGITTAGHCEPNTITYAGFDLPWQDGMKSGSVDAEWHTTPGLTDPNKIRVTSGGTTRNVTSRKPLNQMVDGEPVCKYGRTTNYDCGDIDVVPYEPSNNCVEASNETYALVVPNPNGDDMMDGGDSGGPVFHGNPAKAYGTMVCHTTNPDTGVMIFMPQNFLPNIGVQVDIT
jgi:streptogrisin C